ncbi:hypothetical protein DFJ73DRAFT_899862 [Zopfochytrium polystomum]|nr:hypothetical protein DFJ73DRAFT_899862 [Zopfochytrium polystomum]
MLGEDAAIFADQRRTTRLLWPSTLAHRNLGKEGIWGGEGSGGIKENVQEEEQVSEGQHVSMLCPPLTYAKRSLITFLPLFAVPLPSYAFAFTKPGERLDPRADVFSNRPWPGTHGGKTATAILMKQDDSGKWEVLSIGEQAVLAVSNMRPTDRKKHFFVRHFKMQLYEPATNSQLMIEDSHSSIKLKAVDVIGGLLGHIKGASLKQVRLATRATINEDDVLWVVTVPAIWREGAKKLMREAAETGGLIRSGNSASLLFALEPEAASMWCLTNSQLAAEKGNTIVVADCGGGTIDVTVHTIVDASEITVKEAVPCGGGDFGSHEINKQFFKLMNDVVGRLAISEFEKKHPAVWVELENAWEKAKCTFTGSENTAVTLPSEIARHFERNCADYNKMHSGNFVIEDDRLYIQPADMMKLFAPAIQTTVAHIRDTLAKSREASAVLLVGNFANSAILQAEFRKAFETPKCKVVVPSQPGDCVMKGAVLLGNAPQSVTERISRFAFGTDFCPRFDPKVHSIRHKKIIEGKEYAANQASWFVEYGEKVPFGKIVSQTFFPIRSGQNSVVFNVFEGRAAGITYLTEMERNVRKLGILSSAEAKPSLIKQGVKFSMLFGFSEIRVLAETADGRITSATLNYD